MADNDVAQRLVLYGSVVVAVCTARHSSARGRDIGPCTANYDGMHGRVGEQLKTQTRDVRFALKEPHSGVRINRKTVENINLALGSLPRVFMSLSSP